MVAVSHVCWYRLARSSALQHRWFDVFNDLGTGSSRGAYRLQRRVRLPDDHADILLTA
jgi:hypothetical protein